MNDPNVAIPAFRIRALRNRLGVTQSQFADALGVARNTVARWEVELSKPRGLSLANLHKLYALNPEPRYKVVTIEFDRQRLVGEYNSLPMAKRTMEKHLRGRDFFARLVDEVWLVESSIEGDTILKREKPNPNARTLKVKS